MSILSDAKPNLSCIFILPMLGWKMEDFNNLKNCFVTPDSNLALYLKTSEDGIDNDLCNNTNFIRTYVDSDCPEYSIYEFKIPVIWNEDLNKILNNKINETSKMYQSMIRSYYPSLNEIGKFDEVFKVI